jgi:hypothetical protein
MPVQQSGASSKMLHILRGHCGERCRAVLVGFAVTTVLAGILAGWSLFLVEWLANFWVAKHNNGEPLEVQHLGQVGDIFGGVNALFAALAFAGVGFSAYLQYRSLQVLLEDRKRAAFEPLFLHLTNRAIRPTRLHRKEDVASESYESAMRAVSRLILQNMMRMKDEVVQHDEAYEIHEQLAKKASAIYEDMYLASEDELAPYFRSLYHLFKFIALSELDDAAKRSHASIARAALDKHDVLLLMLNCSSERGRGFKPLIEMYGLLKHAAKQPASDRELCAALGYRTALLDYEERVEYWKLHPEHLADLEASIGRMRQ